ncbi:HAD family hydrolase [Paracoccus zeaxanthinifaciens]|uniref:HAD family hydrolase n=1 Tax=Paracoccus zeaxanthinifaciens TaxID=187400 RepID=UPI0003B7B6FC|nr:HAD family hydrolase [Paracoccus zeaxanthinifaciens]
MIRAIGLDADDTLWENESFFRLTEEEFCAMLSAHAEPGDIAARLVDVERANLERYGYGIKGFMLSMVETAIQLTDGAVDGRTIHRILELGQEMLAHPVNLLPGVEDALDRLSGHRLMLITKGDLMDQERKVAASGLAERFASVEILAEKSPEAYARVLAAQGIAPETFLMAGNSLKSDVIPVIELGGWGVHVPHEMTWVLEHADEPEDPRFRRIATLAELPDLLDWIRRA